MAQRVRADPETRAARGDVASYQLVDAAGRQPASLIIQKQGVAPAPLVASKIVAVCEIVAEPITFAIGTAPKL